VYVIKDAICNKIDFAYKISSLSIYKFFSHFASYLLSLTGKERGSELTITIFF
jgi:hypothetical protein